MLLAADILLPLLLPKLLKAEFILNSPDFSLKSLLGDFFIIKYCLLLSFSVGFKISIWLRSLGESTEEVEVVLMEESLLEIVVLVYDPELVLLTV